MLIYSKNYTVFILGEKNLPSYVYGGVIVINYRDNVQFVHLRGVIIVGISPYRQKALKNN